MAAPNENPTRGPHWPGRGKWRVTDPSFDRVPDFEQNNGSDKSIIVQKDHVATDPKRRPSYIYPEMRSCSNAMEAKAAAESILCKRANGLDAKFIRELRWAKSDAELLLQLIPIP